MRNRKQLIEARKIMKLNKPLFIPIDLDNKQHPYWMTRAFANNKYIVIIDDNCESTHGKCIKAMVQRHDDNPIPFHWREMQSIKNEIFGEDTIAVEYYPKEIDLIDEANIYWLFIYPDNIMPLPKCNFFEATHFIE
ncbi:MAG: hypothetical protein A2015_02185 [Spirochaetes bacterium GWF1_31_7]|nr:MAG: hypothetical protein A2Y30_06035 [Spirochaetes bacterium GWE1_32_154]OHD50724.1 MAG: hypothetical protein A2015_02185 [Spirochaetes bacterium GWF1_31_7]OHD73147.1 MAG: hypothetical protein A2355_05000 [Spirochaetes bacterium RIFOXYB1_FULL_32_8]HBD95060.1 hypothetical protein [Spirochaetia bacterium]HBI38054.1 hypothetical protein [Spirochaetia bacterium]